MSKPKVLFLCTGNSARSQMAEAYLRYYAGDHFDAFSAGLEPKGIHPLTHQMMEEAGIDLGRQYSKDVREYLGKTIFSYLITVCANAERNCPTTFLGSAYHLHWKFDDPAAAVGTDREKLAKFREVRDQIDQRIRSWLEEQGLSLQSQPSLRSHSTE